MNEVELAYQTGRRVVLEAVKVRLDALSESRMTDPYEHPAAWRVLCSLRSLVRELESTGAATAGATARPQIDTGNPVASASLAPATAGCQEE